MKVDEVKATDLMVGHRWISGYEGLYSITDNGMVYSYKSSKFLKPHPNHRGYFMVDLYKNGEARKVVVHRLVAQAFIPNPENKPEIDHVDTDRQNNKVSNLIWCTRKENCNNPLTLKHSGEARKGEKHYLYGKKLSEETKLKMSNARKGRIVSHETRQKIGNANRGRVLSTDARLKMSLAHKGKRMGVCHSQSKRIKQYDKKMNIIKVWDSISDASRKLGILTSSISQCLTSKTKTAGGFIWKYA